MIDEPFVMEHRYVVIKISDIVDSISPNEVAALKSIMEKISIHRAKCGKIPLECVVVESDWVVYDKVWDMVKMEELNNKNKAS